MDRNEKYGQKLVKSLRQKNKEKKSKKKLKHRRTISTNRKAKNRARFFSRQVGKIGAADRKILVDPKHPELCIQRQCELLEISRSSYYYEPKEISSEELTLLRL